MSEDLFGINTKAGDTRKLFSFSKLNDQIFERFKFFLVSRYDWKGESDDEDENNAHIEAMLTALYTSFDKANNNAHGEALEAFFGEQTLENMTRYLDACDQAVRYAHKIGTLKKVGLSFDNINMWDALSETPHNDDEPTN